MGERTTILRDEKNRRTQPQGTPPGYFSRIFQYFGQKFDAIAAFFYKHTNP